MEIDGEAQHATGHAPQPQPPQNQRVGSMRPLHLKKLDLQGLRAGDREETEPMRLSESQLRRQKQQFYEKECSKVEDGLYLSGDWVARNREVLQQHGMTHVLNCVGFICKEHFKDTMQYRTYYLRDSPNEDILTVLYDALEFIDEALRGGGHVLVHCSQGISRSATLVIAYLMWRTGSSYDEVFARVKEARSVANPNLGFTCQLLQWQKRRQLLSPARVRLYRISPHCPQSPMTLVPKIVATPKNPNQTPMYPCNTYRELDRRGAFIVHTPTSIYSWVGASCPPAFATSARYHAELLRKYEHVHPGHRPTIVEVRQSAEPAELLALLDPPLLDAEAARLHARRASLSEELATGSTACYPAQEEDEVGNGRSSGLLGLATSAPLPAHNVQPPHVPSFMEGCNMDLNPGALGLGLGFGSDPQGTSGPGFVAAPTAAINGCGAAAPAASPFITSRPDAPTFHAPSAGPQQPPQAASATASTGFQAPTSSSHFVTAGASVPHTFPAPQPGTHASLSGFHSEPGGGSAERSTHPSVLTPFTRTLLQQGRQQSGGWSVGEVDGYTRDYQMYGDAVRAARAAAGSGGSGVATGLDGTEPGVAGMNATPSPMVWGLTRATTMNLDTPRGGNGAAGGQGCPWGGSGRRLHHGLGDSDEGLGDEDQVMDGVETCAFVTGASGRADHRGVGAGNGTAGHHSSGMAIDGGAGGFGRGNGVGDGRGKKYRRSENGLGISLPTVAGAGRECGGPGGLPPMPCLHTSMGDDEMDAWGG